MNKLKRFSIAQLNKNINNIIEINLYILFEIEGEVSNLSIVDGNAYFTLKDENNRINAIIWNNIFHKNIGICNGDKILCEALLKCYTKNSNFNILIKKYNKVGIGLENEKLTCLKKKLQDKGFFNRKQEIKQFNNLIAIITSIHGAALRDIIYVIKQITIAQKF